MARPKKENLDYFPFDTDLFFDKKIKRLKAKYGTDGICTYLFILCEMYRSGRGYYLEMDEDLILDVSDYFGFSESKTMQIINCLLSRSLLESILIEPVKVITAKSVQRRYQAAKKGARRDILVDERIWLLNEKETEPFIKMHPSEGFSEKNDSYYGKNYNKSVKNHTKESKGKESKGKESMCVTLPCRSGEFVIDTELYNTLTHTYPDMDIDLSIERLRNYLIANPHKQGTPESTAGYLNIWLSDDNERGRYRREKDKNTYEPTYDISEYESTSVTDELYESGDLTDED